MTSSVDGSPTSTPCGTPLGGAPKFGTVIPNRIFVGGIAANTTEQDLKQFFTTYGAVKDSKIIADRAGVSKGYGFITFENQEDAERIIKKESENLVFRDRKLNIGPAIRKQQVLPRAFESPVSQGAVLFSNGVPYTYQNGMAVFASPDGSGYTVPQAQPQTALMVPQTPPMYIQPTYQLPSAALSSYTSYQTSPQWPGTQAAAAAATTGQWRYMAQQSPTQALTPSTANPYMLTMQPELMYAQLPPQLYQHAEMTDTSMLDGGAAVEGSILPVEQSLQLASQPTTYVTEVPAAGTAAVSAGSTGLNLQQQQQQTASLIDASPLQPYNSINTYNTAVSYQAPQPMATTVQSTSKLPSMSAYSVAPYKKPVSSIARRAYTSPTFLVRNGHKVQCVMMPPKSLSASQMALVARPHDGTITPPSGGRV